MPPCVAAIAVIGIAAAREASAKDERPLSALSSCRDPSHGALVESLLDAIDEGVDHMGLHFPAELAASLDCSLDLVPFHHPASLGRWSRQNLI
jgi:hypothetical protein